MRRSRRTVACRLFAARSFRLPRLDQPEIPAYISRLASCISSGVAGVGRVSLLQF